MNEPDPWFPIIVGACWFSAGLQGGPAVLLAVLFVPIFVGVARQDRRAGFQPLDKIK